MPGQVRVTFGSVVVEADPRELLEHLDTPSLMKPFLEMPPEKDRNLYLQCVDELHDSLQFLEKLPQLECCVKEFQEGRTLMDHALSKLQGEALSLLSSHCMKVNKEAHERLLSSLGRETSEGESGSSRGKTKGGEEGGEAKQQQHQHHQKQQQKQHALPELVPSEYLEIVSASAQRMESWGCCKDFHTAYTNQRKEWWERTVTEVGLLEFLPLGVGSERWDKLEDMVSAWNEQLRMLVALAAMEDSLASQALKGINEEERRLTVAHITFRWLKPLIGIGTAVAEGKKSPEKMVPLLDMAETLLDTQSVLRSLSLPSSNQSPLGLIESLLQSVVSSIRLTAEEFRRLIEEDDAVTDNHNTQQQNTNAEKDSPGTDIALIGSGSGSSIGSGGKHRRLRELFVGLKHNKGNRSEDSTDSSVRPSSSYSLAGAGDGDVQKIISYVSNYVLFLMNKDLPYVQLLNMVLGSAEATCDWLKHIMSALYTKLEAKAESLPDERLQALFLMNNKSYILGKMTRKESVAKELLGDEWNEDMKSEINAHRDGFLSSVIQSFDIILSSDRDKDVNLFLRRVLAFNSAFDDLCQKQRQWRVPNPELCALIKKEEKKAIVRQYREFLQSHKHFTEGSRSKTKLLSVSEIESRINEAFPEKKKEKETR